MRLTSLTSLAPLAILLLSLMAGCGDGQPKALDMGGADGSQVASCIEELNEAVGRPKVFDAAFVKGAKPADGKKYTKYSYSIVGKPSVSGLTATAQVRVDSHSGEKVGEVTWTFEKDGDKWKIKAAPLP